jgi:hypothetical protein
MPKLIDKIDFRITDGKVKELDRLRDFYKNLLNLRDGKYLIKIEKVFRQRSNNQNAFYWGPFLTDLKDLLYQEGMAFANKHELHEWLKWTYNRKEIVNEKTGEVVEYPGSTTDLETYNFEAFMNLIRESMRDMYSYELIYPNE